MIKLRFLVGLFLGAGLLGCASAAAPSGSTTPSALPTDVASPTSPTDVAAPEPSTGALTETFTSSSHGYSVGYPVGATIEPATLPWQPPNASGDYFEFDFIQIETMGVFRAASAMAPEGVAIDEWIDEAITGAAAGTCNGPRTTLPEFSIDGQAGRIRDGCPGEVEATVIVGRRAYVFTLFTDSPTARAAFDALAATIDLRPEEAVEVPSPAPS